MAEILAFFNENHWVSYAIALVGFCGGSMIIRGRKTHCDDLETALRLHKIYSEVRGAKKHD